MGEAQDEHEFARLLDAAFVATGLSSAAVAQELRRDGHTVTAATISYWRSGKRRPGRRSSIDVIRAIERILQVESGSLLALVFGGKERGTASSRRHMGQGRDVYVQRVLAMRDALELPEEHASRTLLVHEDVLLDERGVRRRLTTKLLMQARIDGPRCAILGQVDHHGVDGPSVVEPRNIGRVGAVAVDRDLRILMTRVDLPRSFHRLDTWALETVADYRHADARSHGQERWTDFTMREYVLDLHFHPDALPARLESYIAAEAFEEGPRGRTREATLHGTFAQSVLLDLPPGASGVRWHYADEDPDELTAREDAHPQPSPAVLRAWQEFRHEREVALPPREDEPRG